MQIWCLKTTDERRKFLDEWNGEQDVESAFPFFQLNHWLKVMNQNALH